MRKFNKYIISNIFKKIFLNNLSYLLRNCEIQNIFIYFCMLQDLYCVRSDLGNLLKALARLDEAKVGFLCLLFIVVI